MIRINTTVVLRIFIVLLIIGTVFFIWSNSIENASESTVRSNKVIEKVKPIVDPHDRISMNMFQLVVRKTAHFTEFAALGGEALLLFCNISKKSRPGFVCAIKSAAFCLIVAVSDELIQLSSFGRACRFTDVLIDLAGSFAGAILVFAAVRVISAIFILFRDRKSTDAVG